MRSDRPSPDGEYLREARDDIGRLAPRWFVMRDAHAGGVPVLIQPRWTMSLLRGPMTRGELRRALASTETASTAPHDTAPLTPPAPAAASAAPAAA